MDWSKAKEHLDEIRVRYTEIGSSGLLALQISINPLLIRYELKGERTEELFNSIMDLE